jgi:hypothetical protein
MTSEIPLSSEIVKWAIDQNTSIAMLVDELWPGARGRFVKQSWRPEVKEREAPLGTFQKVLKREYSHVKSTYWWCLARLERVISMWDEKREFLGGSQEQTYYKPCPTPVAMMKALLVGSKVSSLGGWLMLNSVSQTTFRTRPVARWEPIHRDKIFSTNCSRVSTQRKWLQPH